MISCLFILCLGRMLSYLTMICFTRKEIDLIPNSRLGISLKMSLISFCFLTDANSIYF